MKYKVGDKVRVRKDLNLHSASGRFIVVGGMLDYKGREVTIAESHDAHYHIKEDPKSRFGWTDEMLEPICTEKIVITSDGVTTTAKKYDGKKIVKEAKAVCSKDDTFNFDVGAKLAMERLMEEDKPKLYNGKVVCVETDCTQLYTKGKIYQFENGIACDNTGSRFACCLYGPIASFDEIRGAATWLEVVE